MTLQEEVIKKLRCKPEINVKEEISNLPGETAGTEKKRK